MERQTSTTTASWELPEAVWECMAQLIPPPHRGRGRPRRVDVRRVTEGIFYVLRTGCQWQALPRERFGPPSTVYYYFARWVREGVFEHLWAEALAVFDELEGLEWTWQSVDGAMVKAPLGARRRVAIPRTGAREAPSAAS